MAGNRGVGRPRTDDQKMNIPSWTLKQSTIIEIETLSEDLSMSRSKLLQIIVENGLNIIKSTHKNNSLTL